MEQNKEMNDEIEIDLKEIIQVLWRKAYVIFLSGIILALAVIIGTKLFVTPQYQSSTRLYVLARQNSETVTNSDLQTSMLLTQDYAELIQSRTVTETVIAQLGLELKHEQLINKISVSTPDNTRILTITVRDSDPYLAKELADSIRDVASEHIQKVMEVEAVNVVDEANIPENPSSPNTMKNGLLAGIFGCVLAAAVVLVRFLMNDTISNSEDVEKYLNLSTLGMIPLADDETKPRKRMKRSV